MKVTTSLRADTFEFRVVAGNDGSESRGREMRPVSHKRLLALMFATVLAFGFAPAAALAVGEGDSSISAPTASGTSFFANGTPITITGDKPDDTTSAANYADFTARGEDAYIIWESDGAKYYLGVDDQVSVYGGGDGSTSPVTVPSTDITMTGGRIKYLYGGNLGAKNKDAGSLSTVEGDVTMKISDTSDVSWLLHGGGAYNSCVKGTVYMEFSNVDLSDESDALYVNGGVYGNGSEGTRVIPSGTMDTLAVANNVVIEAKSSKFYLLGAGGSGSTKVGTGSVTLEGCEVNYLYLSGINGEVGSSNLTLTGCKVTTLSGTNRGFVGKAVVNVIDSEIATLNTGAAPGCFTSDSGAYDGTGITGSAEFNIDGASTVTAAALTPTVVHQDGSYETTVNNVSIFKVGDPLSLVIEAFIPDDKDEDLALNEMTIPEGSALALENVQASIEAGQEFTNAGAVIMDDSSKMTVLAGAKLGNAGTIVGEVDAAEGTRIDYVARTGSKGYTTLQDAIDAAIDGAMVILLGDVQENVTVGESDNIVLELNGFTLDGGTTSGKAALTNNGTVVIRDNSASGTGTIKRSDSGPNDSYYTILNNAGTMTIESGNIQNNAGSPTAWSGSSLICNGPSKKATLNIAGGNISQDNFIAVKNDENGTLNVTGGTIASNTQAVQNWCTAEISGGDLAGAVTTWAYSGKDGETKISGNARIDGDVGAYWYEGSLAPNEGIVPKLEISGGTVTGKLLKGSTTNGTNTTEVDSNNEAGSISVSGGKFGQSVNEAYLSDSIKAELKSASDAEAPYSYYGSVEDALKDAKPGDSVAAVNDEQDTELVMVTLTFNDGKNEDTTLSLPAGTVITLPGADRAGYRFNGWSDGTVLYAAGAEYTVPDVNVTLTGSWTQNYVPPTPSGDKVTVEQSDGGKVTVGPSRAEEGDVVTVTATPDEGKLAWSVTVTDEDGNAVEAKRGEKDGTWTFEMPEGDVTVAVRFVCDGKTDCPSSGLVDVEVGAWYHDVVDWAVETGAMTGHADGSGRFAPDAALTRAQLAAVLYRAAGEPSADVSGLSAYSDCDEGAWYAESVAWATSEGLMTGYDDGTGRFAPDAELTREQLAAVYWRLAGEPAADADLSAFPDGSETSVWATDPVEWAVSTGLLRGNDQTGELDPAGDLTRAQMAAVLYRLANE